MLMNIDSVGKYLTAVTFVYVKSKFGSKGKVFSGYQDASCQKRLDSIKMRSRVVRAFLRRGLLVFLFFMRIIFKTS